MNRNLPEELLAILVEAGAVKLSQEDYDRASARLAAIHTGVDIAIREAEALDKPFLLMTYGINNLAEENPMKSGVAAHLLDIIQDFLRRQMEEDGSEKFWKHFNMAAKYVIDNSYRDFRDKYDPSTEQSNQDGSSEPSETSG